MFDPSLDPYVFQNKIERMLDYGLVVPVENQIENSIPEVQAKTEKSPAYKFYFK